MQEFVGVSNGSNASGQPIPGENGSVYYLESKIREIFILVVAVIGVPTILLLIVTTLTKAYRKHSYSLYLTFVGIYDLIFIFIEATNAILSLEMSAYIREVVSDIPCRIYDHLYYVTIVLSLWLNVALAMDRLIAIALPFRKQRWCTRRTSWIVCGGLILSIHGAGIVYIVMGREEYNPNRGVVECVESPHVLETIMYFICGVCVSMFLIVFISGASVLKLSLMRLKRKKLASGVLDKDRTSKATIALVSIGVATLITRLPMVVNQLFKFIVMTYYPELVDLIKNQIGYFYAAEVMNALGYLNFIQNFFILFIINFKFRNDVMTMLGIKWSA